MQSKKSKWPEWRRLICSVIIPMLLVLLFTYTGVAKLIGLAAFRAQIGKTYIGKLWPDLISVGVPVIEIITALLLVFEKTKLVGLLMSFLLLAGFTAYIIVLLSGNDIPCSCGGVIEAMNWTQHLYFNIAFGLLTLIALYHHMFLHVYKEVS